MTGPQAADAKPWQRIAARLLVAGVGLLQHLPDRPVYRVAFQCGRAASYLMPARRRLARANLLRVCRWLDAHGTAGPRARAAATDPRRLDALVRDVFGHWFLTYVESAMAPRYDAAALRARIELTDPDLIAAAMAPASAGAPGPIFVGLHLGSVELGALYAVRVGRMPVSGPMEQLRDPVLREYFQRTRGQLGMELVPIAGAAPALRDRIARGEAVALVADRVIVGAGTRVELFGAPARLPSGPAVLAVETGGPMYVLAIQRIGPGSWLGRVEAVPVRADGSRRERLQGTIEAQVDAFERIIAAAPEQWWTLLFRIWEEDASR